jgi:hypothetical protein
LLQFARYIDATHTEAFEPLRVGEQLVTITKGIGMNIRAATATVALLLAPAIAGADVVTQWNEKAIASATAGGQNPLVVS